ncbi:hypothetical protein [Flavobacterium sp.]|uniref:hypothetical protein n=1 Tax=Flavobacterium sp. TaxID=239 RepID=UPI0037C0C8FD
MVKTVYESKGNPVRDGMDSLKQAVCYIIPNGICWIATFIFYRYSIPNGICWITVSLPIFNP